MWAFPLSQVAHAAEEYSQGYGFHRWLAELRHAPFGARDVFVVHCAFVVAMSLATLAAVRRPAWGWVVPGLAVLVLINALSHLAHWVMSTSSSSGVVSSLVLWVPLGVIGLVRSWRSLGRPQFWSGVVAGAATQLPVTWLALRAGRL